MMQIDLIKQSLEYISYFFAVIGFIGTVYKTVSIWKSMKYISWNAVKKYIRKILKLIENDGFAPEIIVTVGRSGAIVGSMISGNLSKANESANIPILGCDRYFAWVNNVRVNIENNLIDFKLLSDKRVLLVVGDVSSGGTLAYFSEMILSNKPKELRTAALVKSKITTAKPDYCGKTLPGDFIMPWVIDRKNYARDGRKP